MATIPVQATGWRHARKTITFDGSANNGNLGDIVPAFTITGRIIQERVTAYISVALVCSAPTVTVLDLVAADGTITCRITNEIDFTGATGFVISSDAPVDAAPVGNTGGDTPYSVASNLGVRVTDLTGGADVTGGTLIVNVWYLPDTDDGALAGDDIDTELIAAINATVDTALSDYDAPTKAELDSGLAALPTAAEVVDEFETQSQADPTGFHVNVKEVNGTAQTANDNGADINAILVDTGELQTDWTDGGRLDLLIDAIKAVTDLLTAAHSEPTGVPAANETPLDKLGYIYMMLRNKVTVTASKKTFYGDDDAAEFEKDLSDDGTTYQETEANAI